MPSAAPLPTVEELLNAFEAAAVSQRKQADLYRGSNYDLLAGLGALLFARQASRDRDEARAIYFNTSKDDRLDAYIERHFPGKSRVVDGPGAGFARISRPSAAAGAGVVLAGTRIIAGRAGTDPLRTFTVSEQVPVAATELDLSVPVVSTVIGPEAAIDVSRGQVPILKFQDPLWDTFSVVDLKCGPGTLRETNDATRARLRRERVEARPGFDKAIVAAMKAVGAAQVALFRSDMVSVESDTGLNRIYVGDANYRTSEELLTRCRLAVPGVAIAGTSVQVLGMTTESLTLDVEVVLWSNPDRLDRISATAGALAAIMECFRTRETPFLWSASAVTGAVMRAVRGVQDVLIVPSTPAPELADVAQAEVLVRYEVTAATIKLRFSGPS